ncbi:MAG: putative acyl-CoA dehydrogenase [Marmoricola sp.]|nr:putative acyl-CoA dehydrogenase [Marmoricola sp.]
MQQGLRAEIRAVVAAADFEARCDSWMRGFDPAFSRKIAEHGWIGMTWPVRNGGGGRSNEERLVVTEELLRAGAPVAAHWTADRQIGPSVLRHGTDDLREEFLPAIMRAEVVVCLGLSETEAGSDLAAVRTRAVQVEGGWEITGAKIWTTAAHVATHAYVLARTGPPESRHDGLTEFLVDIGTPGLSVRPIRDLVGDHHFNEMILESAFVPDRRVLGAVGNGWTQVTEQLAFERGGVERYLSTYPLLVAAAEAGRRSPDRAVTERIGALAARLVSLRRMSLELARAIDRGEAPTRLAAELKLLGTLFEKDVVEVARYAFDVCGAEPGDLALLDDGLITIPSGSIRGGASEIMRTVIARQEASA